MHILADDRLVIDPMMLSDTRAKSFTCALPVSISDCPLLWVAGQ